VLSSTYSIQDVKQKLVNDYSEFGLSTDVQFTEMVSGALQDAKFLLLYPNIGSSSYAVIQAKDKGVVSALTESQEYLYWAEVYFACSLFIRDINASTSATSNASSESLSVEGYSYSSTAESGTSTAGSGTIRSYFERGMNYLILAGYNPNALERGSSIFGQGYDLEITDEVV